jgi:ribosome-binding protein aMBF1 (putative translation factor)
MSPKEPALPETFHNELYKGPAATLETDSLDGLGESIARLRVLRGWTQQDLAVRLGVAQQQVQRWERNGWQKIDVWRLQEVLEVMGLELDVSVRLRAARSERSGEAGGRASLGPGGEGEAG